MRCENAFEKKDSFEEHESFQKTNEIQIEDETSDKIKSNLKNELLTLERKISHLTTKNSILSTENALLQKENDLLKNKNKSFKDSSTQYEEIVEKLITGEELEKVANESSVGGGYVYDDRVGMYYQQQSQCYYDAENAIFYHPETGHKYSYDQEHNTYTHISTASTNEINLFKHLISTNAKKKTELSSVSNQSKGGLEEGELVSDEEEVEEEEEEEESEVLQRYIPCVRMVVKQSSFLPLNTLHIVTCKFSLQVGRSESNKKDHIFIDDPFVSKVHCKIEYLDKNYVITDMDSTHGVVVNNNKISKQKQLRHKDVVDVCGHVFELHIHPQSDTCEGCEPGLLCGDVVDSSHNKGDKHILNDMRKLQLKRIKQKYGIQKAAKMAPKGDYQDRAEQRRRLHGNEPFVSDEAPQLIQEENTGLRLLRKMGWKEGEGLGKHATGITQPIECTQRSSRSGLGCHSPKTQRWIEAKKRYQDIE